jgi:hypothetical protein
MIRMTALMRGPLIASGTVHGNGNMESDREWSCLLTRGQKLSPRHFFTIHESGQSTHWLCTGSGPAGTFRLKHVTGCNLGAVDVIYAVWCWEHLRWHDIHTTFHKDRSTHSEVNTSISSIDIYVTLRSVETTITCYWPHLSICCPPPPTWPSVGLICPQLHAPCRHHKPN